MNTIAACLRRFGRDTRGAVALTFGLMLIPLIFAAGVGLDYARATRIRTMLQSTADSAAISGAAAYTAPSQQITATNLAQAFVTKRTAALPPGVTITSTTITPGTTGSGNTVAYTMSVGITASVPTTLMSSFVRTLPVGAYAAATNPVVTMTFDTSGFTASSCDANSVYWYIVPAGGGIPDATTLNNLIWTNTSGANPGTVSISLAASQQIGFAFQNVTGSRSQGLGGCNYGNNAYGSHPGDTQWFYSSLIPPNSQANIAPGGVPTGTRGVYPTTQDCSLQVLQGTQKRGSWTYPSAPQQCFTATGSGDWGVHGHGNNESWTQALTYAAPTCANLNGNSYQFAFNDMGGNADDYDYNDLVFQLQCSGGSGAGTGTSTTGVILTD